MKSLPYCLFAVSAMISRSEGVVTVSNSSLEWTPLAGNFDFLGDQSTGQPEDDIVGTGTNYGFLIGFNDNGASSHTDGELFFRVRVDAGGTLNDVTWIGIDADVNGSLDAFVSMNPKTNPDQIAIYLPGTDANTSPSTTSIGAPTTIVDANASDFGSTYFNYRPVDHLTDGGDTDDITAGTSGDTDYYVSFMVPFQNVVSFLNTNSGITITDESQIRYFVATSTQDNALNQDIGGIDGYDKKSTTPWTDLGAFSASVTLVPEPCSGILAIGSLASMLLIRRRH